MWDRLKQLTASLSFRTIRRVIVFVIGMTVLLIGIALLVLPGPAFVVIPAGLAILGLEFEWARRWLRKAKAMIERSLNGKKPGGTGDPPPAADTAR